MEKAYLLLFSENEYERLVKLIKRDENHRIKNREYSRKKAVSKANFMPVHRGPITYELVEVKEREIPKPSKCPTCSSFCLSCAPASQTA